MGLRRLRGLYGSPASAASPNAWFEFNGVPARRLVTSGRRPREVCAANRALVKRALGDAAQMEAWRAIHESVSVPTGRAYSPPSVSEVLKPSRAPARRNFTPKGFAPGTWFEWTDARDGVRYRCQVSSAGPRSGYVWVVGHAVGGRTLCWLGRLDHPYGCKGSMDGRQAVSLDILANRSPDEAFVVLATCPAEALAAA